MEISNVTRSVVVLIFSDGVSVSTGVDNVVGAHSNGYLVPSTILNVSAATVALADLHIGSAAAMGGNYLMYAKGVVGRLAGPVGLGLSVTAKQTL